MGTIEASGLVEREIFKRTRSPPDPPTSASTQLACARFTCLSVWGGFDALACGMVGCIRVALPSGCIEARTDRGRWMLTLSLMTAWRVRRGYQALRIETRGNTWLSFLCRLEYGREGGGAMLVFKDGAVWGRAMGCSSLVCVSPRVAVSGRGGWGACEGVRGGWTVV